MALRYAVLWHSSIDQPHYDVMFETAPGSALATWRSPMWPIVGTIHLTRLRDHRAAFLNYTGSLSQDRGEVTQIVSGTCEIEINDPAHWLIRWPVGSVPEQLRLQNIRDDLWQAEAVVG